MAKKIIRLTMSDLSEAVKRAVSNVLNEDVLGNDWNVNDYEENNNVLNNYEPFENQMEDQDNEHNWSTVKEPTVDNTVYESKESKYMKQSNGKYWLTEEGKKVPSKCPKCDAKMNVRIKGEPIFECDNGHYFGTVKFSK